jgi:hypothetical protein
VRYARYADDGARDATGGRVGTGCHLAYESRVCALQRRRQLEQRSYAGKGVVRYDW